jgi:hypothetical protein
MPLDLCERLLGRSHWIETQAIIVSKTSAGRTYMVKVKNGTSPRYEMHFEAKLKWQDQAGREHESSLRVQQGSPIYALAIGTAIPLRYNPAVPDSWYLPQILHRQAKRWTGIIVVLAALAFAILAYLRL